MSSVVLLVLFLCVLALTCFLLRLISIGLKAKTSKINIHTAQNLLDTVDDMIRTNVAAVNQTSVEGLKKNYSFMQLDREQAFVDVYDRVKDFIDRSDTSILQAYIYDLDEWVRCRIEYYVRMGKDSKD